MKTQSITISIAVGAMLLVASAAVAAKGNFELRRTSKEEGGYTVHSSHKDRQSCEKARKKLEQRDPKAAGSCGCMKSENPDFKI